MSPRLAVTLPTALPTAMSTFPWVAAMTDTSSSGSVVARLTMVAPTISFGMPLTSAIQEAASTNQSPPFTIRMIPARKIIPSIAYSMHLSPSCSHTGSFTIPCPAWRIGAFFGGGIKFSLGKASASPSEMYYSSGASPPTDTGRPLTSTAFPEGMSRYLTPSITRVSTR